MTLVDKLEALQAKKAKVAAAYAQATVAAITGSTPATKDPSTMKAPNTELVSRLQAKTEPQAGDDAPLAGLLAKAQGELAARALWQQSGLAIDAFYQQLRTEMSHGWIIEPEKAVMKQA